MTPLQIAFFPMPILMMIWIILLGIENTILRDKQIKEQKNE